MSLETLRSSCTRFGGRRLWFGRILLLSRQLSVIGWRGFARFKESVPLTDVASVARANGSTAGNLVLLKKDGSELRLRVNTPGIWRMQIDYRLRRLAAFASAPQPEHESQGLPTADDIEQAADEGPTPESLDGEFFEKELGEIPVFADDSQAFLEPLPPPEESVFLEPVAVERDEPILESRPDGQAEPASASSELLEHDPERLQSIGEDLVSDAAMDSASAEDVVLGWLAPASDAALGSASLDPEILEPAPVESEHADEDVEAATLEPVAVEVDAAEDTVEVEVDRPLVVEAGVAEADTTSAEVEVVTPDETVEPAVVRPALPIASSPYTISEIYSSPDRLESEAEPEIQPEAESEIQPAAELQPAAESELQPAAEPEIQPAAEPEGHPISVERAKPRSRRPIRSLAELRPMSLADLIAESQPNWTSLADIE
jgi:hypothetical protein